MGKATIVSNLGEGLYTIRVDFDNAAVDARILLITDQVVELDAELVDLASAKADKLALFNAASSALNVYITTTPPDDIVANPSAINALTDTLYKTRIAYDKAASDEKRAKLKKVTIEKEKDYLERYCPASFEVDAWCVAYNAELAGEIKTIECDYLLERNKTTNQVYNDTGFWLPADSDAPDSRLQHPMATSQHATWFNLAMAPAMQRHQGRYRIATLTSVNTGADTCDLTFDGRYDVDEYQSRLIDTLPILPQFNDVQQLNYTGAAIVYPPCNAEVFLAGDRVIVDLHDGLEAPTVIGFYSNPRLCEGETPGPSWGNIQVRSSTKSYIFHSGLVVVPFAPISYRPPDIVTVDPVYFYTEFWWAARSQQYTVLQEETSPGVYEDLGLEDSLSYGGTPLSALIPALAIVYDATADNNIMGYSCDGSVVFYNGTVPPGFNTEAAVSSITYQDTDQLTQGPRSFTANFDNGTVSGTHDYTYYSTSAVDPEVVEYRPD